MADNGWGTSGTPGQPGNPWRQEPPQNTGGSGSGAGGLATGVIVAAVVAALLVIVLVVGGIFVWSRMGGGDDGDRGTPDGDRSAPQFTSVPQETGTSEESVTSTTTTPTTTATGTPSPTGTPTESTESTGSPTTTDSRPGTDAPEGLDGQGWTRVSAATCNADDRWIFAGTNGTDRAVVCRVGEAGDLYYRGYYNNRPAEYDIDMDRVSSDRWVTRSLDGNGTRVVISPSGIEVVDGGGETGSSRTFTWNSSDSQR